MISVFVVVDVSLYRDGIVDYLERQDGLVVVGSSARLEESLDAIRERPPDVVLVDACNRRAIPTLRQTGSHVVVLGVDEQEDDIVACAQLGAAGYISRSARLESLPPVLESVTRDEMICSPKVAAMLFRRLSRTPTRETLNTEALPTDGHPRLSGREREILELIEAGLSNKEIAQRLHIQLSTVKNHVHHILRKLGVNRRDEAVERAQWESRVQVVPRRDC